MTRMMVGTVEVEIRCLTPFPLVSDQEAVLAVV